MPNGDDDLFHRKEDMENLAKIPVIEERLINFKDALERIEKNTEGFLEVKTNVKWLMGWHWNIVIGIISAILISGAVGIYAFLKK